MRINCPAGKKFPIIEKPLGLGALTKSFANVVNPDNVIKKYGADVLRIYEMQKGKCHWCFKAVTLGKHHIDHIYPLSKGGGNEVNNICISCPTCNLKKGNKTPVEFSGRLF
jgi:5-methylcytosine-specific restriction endonuclease McrA